MQDRLFQENEEVIPNKEYRVLARKYRPRIFKEIVSQSHIVRIIENAIKSNKIHHSYILTGIRGVGKTTFARIFAKTLNCTDANVTTPTIEPCLKCSNCITIERSRHQDIIEIDAASHTSVEDVREIIENSKYKPIIARYKVYIIDEVHMLSNSAFNALLKTLEEPPEHVKFILATTEIKKIPLTVKSRCQRFDLRRFTILDMVNYLSTIAEKEGYELKKPAATLLARTAEGSARDGLSLLDQAMLTCKCEKNITLNAIMDMLGMVSIEYIYDIFENIVNGDVNTALKIVRDLYEKGAEPIMILRELIDITYKVSLCKIENVRDFVILDFEIDRCNSLAKNLSVIVLSRLWQMFNKVLTEMKLTHNEIYTLEMALIKIVHANLHTLPEDILKDLTETHKESHSQYQEYVKKKAIIVTQ